MRYQMGIMCGPCRRLWYPGRRRSSRLRASKRRCADERRRRRRPFCGCGMPRVCAGTGARAGCLSCDCCAPQRPSGPAVIGRSGTRRTAKTPPRRLKQAARSAFQARQLRDSRVHQRWLLRGGHAATRLTQKLHEQRHRKSLAGDRLRRQAAEEQTTSCAADNSAARGGRGTAQASSATAQLAIAQRALLRAAAAPACLVVGKDGLLINHGAALDALEARRG